MNKQNSEHDQGCACGSGGCVCRACGMPMKEEKDYGTEENGSKNCDYCIHCYADGVLITEEEDK